MIHERHFDLTTDLPTSRDIYMNNDGTPATKQEFEIAESKHTDFRCPECGSRTFGRFEPFVERGITKWCSNCGHMEYDKTTLSAYIQRHPEIPVEL